MLASKHGHLEVVRLLCDARADKDKAAPDGTTKAKMNQGVATYESMKQAHESGAKMPAAVPAASVPVDSAPVAAAPSAVSAADFAEAKKQVELLTWVAKKRASEGSPQAAAMKAKIDHAVATYESMKQGSAATPAAAPTALAPVVASTPVAAAPATPASGAEVAQAKQATELANWAANALASKGSPQAATRAAKAQQAMQTCEALKASQTQIAACSAAVQGPLRSAQAAVSFGAEVRSQEGEKTGRTLVP
jgi:hypothetical protein